MNWDIMALFSLVTKAVLVLSLCCMIDAANVQFKIYENNEPGFVLGNPVQVAGIQRQGLAYFMMAEGDGYELHFSIDESTGELMAVVSLDRESLCEFLIECELVLEVGVHSTTGDDYFTIIRVVVIVEDVNDNQPLFPQPVVHLPINEAVLSGTTFTLEGARDKDTSDKFSLQTYELIPKYADEHLPFNISFTKNIDGSSTVKLNVTHPLNREEKDGYEFYVVAKDGGSPALNGSLYVNINVEDVNDNYPQFEQKSYNVTVREDMAVNTTILTLVASDLDKDSNAYVTYRFSPHQPSENIDTFTLDAMTGDIRVNERLNVNTKRSYKLIVEATDGGDVPLTSQTLIRVDVITDGNNPPEIYVNTLPSNEIAEISEYANMGAVVAHVAVVDHDGGRNGDVACSLSHGTFGIEKYDANEYKVVTTDMLDRERQPSYTLTVACTDDGNPELNTTRTFNVSVLDENDNAPKFKQQRYFSVIDENNEVGVPLAIVSAYDLDTGINSELVYEVAPFSAKYAFADPNTGVVMANKRFDKEGQEGTGLSLTIYAVDQGTPKRTATTTVHVSIRDMNDQRPVFVQSYFQFRIDEHVPPGSFVGKLNANDGDTRINAETVYSLVNMADNKSEVPFVVLLDGAIETNGEIDREFESEYTFIVKAADSGEDSLFSEATVTVIIEDINDNAPVIHYPAPGNDTVHLPLTTSTESPICSVIASDSDDPARLSSKLTFSLSTQNDTNYFTINPVSGDIYLSERIPSSNFIGKVFILLISVRDHGAAFKSCNTTLHVVVIAGNTIDLTLPNLTHEKNMLIFIILASVTFAILAIIIVTIFIFILRRIDVHRKEASARIKVLSDDMYYRGTDKVDNLSDLPAYTCQTEKAKKGSSVTSEETHVLVDRAFQRQNSCKHFLLDVSDDDAMYVLLNKI